MTNKEFDAATKRLDRAVADLLKLSQYQLWAEEAEAIADMLSAMVERMKAQ